MSSELEGSARPLPGDGLPDGQGGLAVSRPLPLTAEAGRRWRPTLAGLVALRVAYVVAALLLFVFALEILKAGAVGVADLLQGISAQGAANILGFGWLGAYLVLSGSPVAAIALSLFAGAAISDMEAFAMLNGSRLGASFIVLFVGALYYWGRRRTADGIYIGVVALLTTFTVYAAVVPLGSLVLERGWLDGVQASAPPFALDLKEWVFQPAATWGVDHLARLLLFVGGIALLLGSFAVFDRVLPNLEQPGLRMERISRLLHQPFMMFLLGLLITAMTLSVSISLTLLIPLSLKGYLRRDGIIPYVMGANISTWVDTMAAALLLDSPRAFTIVFTQMAVGAAISLAILMLAYGPYSRAILALARHIVGRRLAFVFFLGAILVLPLALLFA